METKYIDVLVVGSGVAGLYCALNLRKDLDVMWETAKSDFNKFKNKFKRKKESKTD